MIVVSNTVPSTLCHKDISKKMEEIIEIHQTIAHTEYASIEESS